MSWNLLIFALIGAFAGGAARLLYPNRQFTRILGTLILGMVGAILGGMLSWNYWPAAVDDIHTGALLMSLLGALVVLVCWSVWAYGRRISGRS
jgi:uncharacterized membrane protein YeaQ/YmgE (transglycosylase-associated protein family)